METILDALQDHGAGDEQVFCHFLQSGQAVSISYRDLRCEAGRFARLFRQSGVQRGEVVLIFLRHSPDLLYSFLGAMLAGAIPSFMPCPTSKQDPTLYWSSHRKLFERIGAGAVLTSTENLAMIREHTAGLPLQLLEVEKAGDFTGDFVPESTAPETIAFLQHSSGTTGLKKGVALTHAAVLRQVQGYAGTLKLAPDDCIVSWLPLYHDMGLIACFLLPLLTRTTVVMLDPFEWVVNPSLLFAAIKRFGGTLCWMPNFAFHHLCRTVRPSPGLDLSSMRAWIDCSEPCRAAGAGVKPEQLQVCYAMAETVFAVTQTQPGQTARVLPVDPEALRQGRIVVVPAGVSRQTFLSTGPVIRGLQVCIRNEPGHDVTEDRIGEICLAGHCLFDGYFKLEEETRRKLRDGWYHTGDLGFLHDGELYVTGRKNGLIIVHGRNYYAHDLEHLVNQMPGVHPGRNVASGWFRPEVGSEEVVIIAEVDSLAETHRAGLVQRVKQGLLDQTGLQVYDVHLVGPGWLVKTTSGKISRTENLLKYQAALTASAAA